MDYAYMVEHQGSGDTRDNTTLIRLIKDLQISEDYVYIKESDDMENLACFEPWFRKK